MTQFVIKLVTRHRDGIAALGSVFTSAIVGYLTRALPPARSGLAESMASAVH